MSKKTPAECSSMAELRVEIDAIDRALVALLAERTGYIDRAVDLKRIEGLPARTTGRVEEVISKVKGLARQHDFDEALAESLWRHLIEWSILREEAVLGAAFGKNT